MEHYRLRGEIGGVRKTYPIEGAETTIGSTAENDVVLPVRGVSRHHATVRWGADGIVIEDRESRNGVFVNGAHTLSARLKPGDEIRLGPVVFCLEAVEPEEAVLGLELGSAAGRGQGLLSSETTSNFAVPDTGDSSAWLRVFDGVLEKLSVIPDADARGALAVVLRELPARACCLFESTGADTLVVAAVGEVGDLGGVGGAEAGALFGTGGEAEGARTWAILPARGGALGLAIWGDYPGRATSARLLKTLLRLWQRLGPGPVRELRESTVAAPKDLVFPEGCVLGESSAMASLHGQMKPLVQGDPPVLILGETGVGKELVARTLHASSRRAKGPFVAVNCAAIPSDQLEAEMFGVARGAATGVVERPGKFRLAQGGTLLLDEIGDMPLDLQVKLLRALEEREIQPVGGAPIPVDLRVIAATNTDLPERVEAGRFRRDLYFRIAGYTLHVPPLRDRRDDITAFVDAFLRAFARECHKSIRGITLKALRALIEYRWPGNVRELEHEVRRLAYLCPDGEAVDSSMLSPHILSPIDVSRTKGVDSPEERELDLEGHVRQVEERVVRRALQKAGGNRTKAAKLLGISRNGLADKIARLGITD